VGAAPVRKKIAKKRFAPQKGLKKSVGEQKLKPLPTAGQGKRLRRGEKEEKRRIRAFRQQRESLEGRKERKKREKTGKIRGSGSRMRSNQSEDILHPIRIRGKGLRRGLGRATPRGRILLKTPSAHRRRKTERILLPRKPGKTTSTVSQKELLLFEKEGNLRRHCRKGLRHKSFTRGRGPAREKGFSRDCADFLLWIAVVHGGEARKTEEKIGLHSRS